MPKETIDYTTLRLRQHVPGEPNCRVERCPKCGRKAVIHRYRDKTAMAIHGGHVEMGFFHVDDSCQFRVEAG